MPKFWVEDVVITRRVFVVEADTAALAAGHHRAAINLSVPQAMAAETYDPEIILVELKVEP